MPSQAAASARTTVPVARAPKRGDHVFLVDGSSYIFRAYHALPPLNRKSDGLQVNGSDLVRGIASRLPAEVTVTGGLAGDGARFKETFAFYDGAPARFTPELVAGIQAKLGSDIAMCLDICAPVDVSRRDLEDAVRRTTLWAACLGRAST